MILRLWEWSQDNPEEAGSVFFKLKFSCDCLLKCPCFTLWGEVDLCRLELPEHKLHNNCCLQATSKVSLETRADAPASSLTSGFISAWILCPADSGQLTQKAVKLQLSYIRLKKSILFLFYSFIISVVSLMRDLETRVQSLHFNTKSVFFFTVKYGWNQQKTVCQVAWLKYSLYFGPWEGKSEVVILTKPSSSVS